jgi:hypothetical protein
MNQKRPRESELSNVRSMSPFTFPFSKTESREKMLWCYLLVSNHKNAMY